MNPKHACATVQSMLAILCAVLLAPGGTLAYAPQQSSTPASSQAPAAKIPADQLDSLVAPVALYPDPLLAQVLAASTYPLEIILLQRWLEKNKNSEGQAVGRRGRRSRRGIRVCRPWPPFPKSSNGWATTSSGQRTWATPFSRSRPM